MICMCGTGYDSETPQNWKRRDQELLFHRFECAQQAGLVIAYFPVSFSCTPEVIGQRSIRKQHIHCCQFQQPDNLRRLRPVSFPAVSQGRGPPDTARAGSRLNCSRQSRRIPAWPEAPATLAGGGDLRSCGDSLEMPGRPSGSRSSGSLGNRTSRGMRSAEHRFAAQASKIQTSAASPQAGSGR